MKRFACVLIVVALLAFGVGCGSDASPFKCIVKEDGNMGYYEYTATEDMFVAGIKMGYLHESGQMVYTALSSSDISMPYQNSGFLYKGEKMRIKTYLSTYTQITIFYLPKHRVFEQIENEEDYETQVYEL